MAKTISVEVKTKGENAQVLGSCEFPEFESVSEALAAFGEEKLLAKINAKVKADAVNAVRVAAAQNTPEKQISRIMRAKRKGEISREDAAKQVSELLAQLS